jgi:hypothetical protein
MKKKFLLSALISLCISTSLFQVTFAQSEDDEVAPQTTQQGSPATTGTSLTPSPSTPSTGAPTQSISGDGVCGATYETRCDASSLKKIGDGLRFLFVWIGIPCLVAFVMGRLVVGMIATFEGKPGQMALATKQAGQVLLGFLLLLLAFKLVGVFLKAFGAQTWVGKLLLPFTYGFFEHAYAQETLLPNPYGSNSLYDIIISGANLAMRFFVYPALIAAWVASGFKFIYSQGNPDGLKTARSWLLISVLVTIVAFMIQGFIVAFKGTAEKILSTRSEVQHRTGDRS